MKNNENFARSYLYDNGNKNMIMAIRKLNKYSVYYTYIVLYYGIYFPVY